MALIAALSAPTVCQAQAQRSREFKNKYKLQEAVVLSRHNIRAPLSDSKSALGRMTPHKWHKWVLANPSLQAAAGLWKP